MERLFPPEGYRDHAEMYLKAIMRLRENGEAPARVGSISRMLKVKPPSAVGMLRKLEAQGLIGRSGRSVILTSAGRREGQRITRNCRLVEVFMRDALRIRVDDRVACQIEHVLTKEFVDGLCTMLHHPRSCPHGKPIPMGRCCRASGAS